MLVIKAIPNLPIFEKEDDFVSILLNKFSDIQDGDILAIAHTIISRIEGHEIDLNLVNPSQPAINFSRLNDKDPRLVELILQESKSIVRMSKNLIISETKHGFICANAGIDRSNAKPGFVLLLPPDPDQSARQIQFDIYDHIQKNVGIIITDTFGRPFRIGTTNIAIGIAGFNPITSYKGQKDLFGYELQTTEVCIADELATAAGILMGQANEGTPVIHIRGIQLDIIPASQGLEQENFLSAKRIARSREFAVFW